MKKLLTSLAVLSLACLTVFAQGKYQVKGVVEDALGPVIGATVMEQGTTNGTSTGLDGDFVLTVKNADAIVEISCIGYASQVFKASQVPAVIMLAEDTNFLDEVVVIGYGTVRKSDLTGSVAALKPDTKNKGVVVSAQDMLSGKIAGVNVTSGGGTPGGGASIRIRGGSSLNASNDPLIVIDGIAMDNNGVKGLANGLSLVNPADIESFNVLKDASATAIYGSRGSNGVIIITTKRGRAHQATSLTYNGSATASMRRKSVQVMDGDQYREFITNKYGEGSDPYNALGTANTDWQKEIYRLAISNDHNFTVTGAVKDLPYRVSFGFTDEEGILKTSSFKRLTSSVNLNPQLLDKHLTLNIAARGMYALSRYADGGAIGGAVWMDPTKPVRDYESQDAANFGNYSEWKTNGDALKDPTYPNNFNSLATANPVAVLDLKDDRAQSRSLVGSVEADYKVHGFEDLHLHATFGADLSSGKQTTNVEPTSPYAFYYGSYGSDEITKRNLSWNVYSQYAKDLGEGSHYDVMVGYEWQHFWRKQHNDYFGLYPSTNTGVDEDGKPLAGTERPHTPYNYETENYLVSFMGRANYTLQDRFLFTGTFRYDGSSRFYNHWALFPSFAFAWKLMEEDFIKDMGKFSDLKFRLGYGKTGQQEGIGDYNYFATYSTTTGTDGFYPVVGDGVLFRPDAYDKNLEWEKTSTYNAGLDWAVMNNRLSGSLDWYYRHTTDLLNRRYVAAGSNFRNQIWSNVGSLVNTGIELSVDYKIIEEKDVFWTVSGNLTYNSNRITELIGEEGYYIATGGISAGTGNTVQAHTVGKPANSYYVYQQIYDKNGLPIEGAFVDRNKDGVINEADKYFYKSPWAPVTAGLSSRYEYKTWDFGVNFRLSLGNYVYNDLEAGSGNLNDVWSNSSWFGNRPLMALEKNWQTYDSVLSDYFVQNGSFLKCDNITVGYSFNDVLKVKDRHLNGRVYATASNVFCITPYKGIDPEVFGGIDNNLYPRPFSFIVGMSLNF